MRIAEADIVIGPVSPFASVKCWADDGGLCRPSRLSLLRWNPVSKVEEPESGSWTPHYWAMCHFYHGKPFWKWENQSSEEHPPVAVPKTSVNGKSLGQNCPPSAYRSYYSSNDTILANFWRFWVSVGPYLTSHLRGYRSY